MTKIPRGHFALVGIRPPAKTSEEISKIAAHQSKPMAAKSRLVGIRQPAKIVDTKA